MNYVPTHGDGQSVTVGLVMMVEHKLHKMRKHFFREMRSLSVSDKSFNGVAVDNTVGQRFVLVDYLKVAKLQVFVTVEHFVEQGGQVIFYPVT